MANYLRLSPSTLGLFKECPRCFWLHIRENHKRPQGPFSSLPSGMDSLIKSYFDKYRGSLPPELMGKVRGQLFGDLKTLEKWRSWRNGLAIKDEKAKVELIGALDDCLVEEVDGELIFMPLDYKTRGFDLKDDSQDYYQHQLDLYTLMLERNGYKTAGIAYLIYYIPKKLKAGNLVEFEIVAHQMTTNINNARLLIKQALDILNGPLPPHQADCDFCRWQQLFSLLG